MRNVYNKILQAKACGEKLFALLIDPEKCTESLLEAYVCAVRSAAPDFVFVGGSQLQSSVDGVVKRLKEAVSVPVVLFPGNVMQLTDGVDAVLLLSLLSGRNAEYLIGQHVRAARALKRMACELIPTAYLLIDGGVRSAVSRVSNTLPLAADDVNLVVDTALAGEQLGMRLVYLEAGSGAVRRVPEEVIGAVCGDLSLPIVVGGGICSPLQMMAAYRAGADVVVVGNALERDPQQLAAYIKEKNHRNW